MINDWGEWVPGVRLLELQRLEDNRGWFLKVLKRDQLVKSTAEFGEIYISSGKPGAFKGGHYHSRTTEWFLVIKGEARFWCKPDNSEEWRTMILKDRKPVLIEVCPGICHAFENVKTSQLLVLAYCNEPYNPNDPDTFPVPLPQK